ncbi:cytochrome c [Ectothiorhodospiraceae bacterium BW-2]|nr:cytochrome c [Ectothiorhodospiraceae bacterium BW-2]
MTYRSTLISAISAPLLAASLSLPAEESLNEGAALHQQSCLRCHGSELYTRADRKVTHYAALNSRVNMCKDMLGLTWFDDQVQAVTDYLNQTHYHFSR